LNIHCGGIAISRTSFLLISVKSISASGKAKRFLTRLRERKLPARRRKQLLQNTSAIVSTFFQAALKRVRTRSDSRCLLSARVLLPDVSMRSDVLFYWMGILGAGYACFSTRGESLLISSAAWSEPAPCCSNRW